MNDRNGSDVLFVSPDGLRKQYLSVFQDRCIFVRELLQNSVEAIRKNCGSSKQAIRIDVDPALRTFSISDDGVGMDFEPAKLAVASLFHSGWAKAADRDEASLEAVGRFGMGLTTCLLVADNYRVVTAPITGGPASEHIVEVSREEGPQRIKVSHRKLDQRVEHGTTVTVSVGISDTNEIFYEACDPSAIERRLKEIAGLLEIPIFLNGRQISAIGDRHDLRDQLAVLVEDHERIGELSINDADKNGYINAFLWFSSDGDDNATVRVYSRGILVGEVNASEVWGPKWSFVQGVVDSNYFDLQIDRNRIQDNDRLSQFQDTFSVLLCAALAELSRDDWRVYVALFNLFRKQFLSVLLDDDDDEMVEILGQRVPFKCALSHDKYRPAQKYIENQLEVDETYYLAFVTPATDASDVLAAIDGLGALVPEFSEYAPTMHGKMNLDLYYAMHLLSHISPRSQLVRCDVVVKEIAKLFERQAGAHQIPVRGVSDRLGQHCDVSVIHVPSLARPVLVSTPHEVAQEEELPGYVESGMKAMHEFVEMLKSVDDHNMEIDRLMSARRQSSRPTLAFNAAHPFIKKLGRLDAADALNALTIAGAARLLMTDIEGKEDVLNTLQDSILQIRNEPKLIGNKKGLLSKFFN